MDKTEVRSQKWKKQTIIIFALSSMKKNLQGSLLILIHPFGLYFCKS